MSLPPTIAVYVSSHGYGHCTRTAALLESLDRELEVSLRVVASCPRWLWPQTLDECTVEWRDEACDVDVVQADDISVDRAATARALAQWEVGYTARVVREAAWLGAGTDLVLGDVPPLAFDAAALAGIRSVALANFSWDWIYEAMGFAESALRARTAYAKASLLLELTPCSPMNAFTERLALGVIGRRSQRAREEVRAEIGIAVDERLVVFAFRDPGCEFIGLPPRVCGLRYLWTSGATPRSDVVAAPAGVHFTEVLSAADAVVAKAGYGIIGDTALCGTRLLYTERSGFPEDAVLTTWLAERPGCARVAPHELAAGSWLDPLEELLRAEPPVPETGRGLGSGAAALRAALGLRSV